MLGNSGSAPTSEPAPTTSSTRTTVAPSSTAPTVTVSVPVGAPLEIIVPNLGIDAPIKPTAFKNQEINPPTVDDVYWIEAYGWPGVDSDNTVYLLGHSWDEGDAVFNALFDRASQTSKVDTGDEVDVVTANGTVRYVVDRTARYARDSLKDNGDVWAKVPGRLILITCFQQNDGLDARDNFVVYAHVIA